MCTCVCQETVYTSLTRGQSRCKSTQPLALLVSRDNRLWANSEAGGVLRVGGDGEMRRTAAVGKRTIHPRAIEKEITKCWKETFFFRIALSLVQQREPKSPEELSPDLSPWMKLKQELGWKKIPLQVTYSHQILSLSDSYLSCQPEVTMSCGE